MKFKNIYKESEENLKLSLLSLWTPGDHPMRNAVNDVLQKEPLITEPVFQSTFGWETARNEEWRNSLHPNFVDNLHIGETYRPYEHQAQSWINLNNGNSIVVTSGTGSGKTECFMYPVLNDLYCNNRNDNKISAIFIYPLNALMEDQKTRLSRLCSQTGLKFGVYNGNTPEYEAIGQSLPNEVCTRKDIRDDNNSGTRPNILLTNPSMLEYILVRKADQNWIEHSRGSLKWIVIDEAHTYSGSAAVELSYQIKRILEAFGMDIHDVRFACTSATIGGQDETGELKQYISTLTGQSEDRIAVIGGNRIIPNITLEELRNAKLPIEFPDFQRILNLRTNINERDGISLKEIWQILLPDRNYDIETALDLTDMLCETKINGKPLLCLRAHFFMRAIYGLYTCANHECQGSSGTPYGYMTTYKSKTCPHCGAPLLEIVQCKTCKEFILLGKENEDTSVIEQYTPQKNENDLFSIDDDDNNNDNDIDNGNTFFLLPRPFNYTNPIHGTHESSFNITRTARGEWILEEPDNGNGIWHEIKDDKGISLCPSCGNRAQGGKRMKLLHFRIPIDFINKTITPVLLKETSLQEGDWGKYIAFTDSRQGTAISAKNLNIDVERTVGIEKIMEKLADTDYIEPNEIKDLLYNEQIFQHIVKHDLIDNRYHIQAYKAALLRNFIGRKPLYENDVETFGLIKLVYPGVDQIATLPNSIIEWNENNLANSLTLQDWKDYLKLFLDYHIRLGNHIQCLIKHEREYIRDANVSTPIAGPDSLHAQIPVNNGNDQPYISKWPELKSNQDGTLCKTQSRIVVLLCAGLGLTVDALDSAKRTIVNNILKDVWNTLTSNSILKLVRVQDNNGYNNRTFYHNNIYVGCAYLDISDANVCNLRRNEQVTVCPVSRKLLDTTFKGYSPLISGDITNTTFQRFRCRQGIDMPVRPSTDNNEELQEWLVEDERIASLKQNGFWNDRYKYYYQSYPAFLAAEHSAQQSKERLREYTQQFINNEINVLHCSTTMEMGVDIGDIDLVLMDTIPPTAANYMQRVGRAGRNGQSKATAISLCNNSPIAQDAFRNPMWAIESETSMRPSKSSSIIVQRHINSYFFRKYLCTQQVNANIPTTTIQEFFENDYTLFTNYLEDMQFSHDQEGEFHCIFGNRIPYTVDLTLRKIQEIYASYQTNIQELRDIYKNTADPNKQRAIRVQLDLCENENLLKYLSESQFIPNANMPTGIVNFNFIDGDSIDDLYELYDELRAQRNNLANETDSFIRDGIQEEINQLVNRINKIKKGTSASRDICTALNEYAPGQTIVINEKNYTSAGIILNGDYDDATRRKFIYHCTQCGKTIYSDVIRQDLLCPSCQAHNLHGIVNYNLERYTQAYEPVGFRTDPKAAPTRFEKSDKQFFDIKAELLESDWSNPTEVSMCQITGSEENGEILYYNAGSGFGFAICKKCGKATLESEFKANIVVQGTPQENIPIVVKPGHNNFWNSTCDANQGQIARNVVLTARHQTCYAVFKFYEDVNFNTLINDEQLAYSLGVLLTRALAKYLSIDQREIAFGIKKENNASELFIYDTARGGCGYSLRFTNPVDCQNIFDIAYKDISNSNCNCENTGSACTRCLVDRYNYNDIDKLSKTKALDWLRKQQNNIIALPDSIQQYNPDSRVVYQDLKRIVSQAIKSADTQSICLFISDLDGDASPGEWISRKSRMGFLIDQAINKNKEVQIFIEYHPDEHRTINKKIPYLGLADKFADCQVTFIEDMGEVKTALIINDGSIKHYYTDNPNHSLEFSDKWGDSCKHCFVDGNNKNYTPVDAPLYKRNEDGIIREGMPEIDSFELGNYYSSIIRTLLRDGDEDEIRNILNRQDIRITFSDPYISSGLATLLLVYLIKELKDTFQFDILSVDLKLDSYNRNVENKKFNDHTYISFNWDCIENADEFTINMFSDILDIRLQAPFEMADHYRWLRLEREDGRYIEIRPDHSISGGWQSRTKYMDIDNIDEHSKVLRDTKKDALYYVIIK